MNQEMEAFLRSYNGEERRIASKILSKWLPFLSPGLCETCAQTLSHRIRLIDSDERCTVSTSNINHPNLFEGNCDTLCTHSAVSTNEGSGDGERVDSNLSLSCKDQAYGLSDHTVKESPKSNTILSTPPSPRFKKSWADMTLDDELLEQEENKNEQINQIVSKNGTSEYGESTNSESKKVELSREQRENIRFNSVKRKKDFVYFEEVKGRKVNILNGLELHTGVFSSAEQARIVKYVEQLQEAGQKGLLKDRTYSAPQKWMRGKGRITLQFGCCYNYATDRKGNPPGILKHEIVDPLPPLFKVMIKRLVRWNVLPPSCVPDSCIVNIYEEGDCIPPHIDSHDFVRPFCTVSFLSECQILFGANLKSVGPGEFSGSSSVSLPIGSVFVLNENGADVAKHCVPAVPTKRISITFRKMDGSKRPNGYAPEPDLQGLVPLSDAVDDHGLSRKHSDSRSINSVRQPADGREDGGRRYINQHRDSYSSNRVRRGPPYRQRY